MNAETAKHGPLFVERAVLGGVFALGNAMGDLEKRHQTQPMADGLIVKTRIFYIGVVALFNVALGVRQYVFNVELVPHHILSGKIHWVVVVY